ncbi:molybdenum cofactor guanylyltransferase [Sporomusa acidovorans]|uniref:Probable molybdenum cofactor guanylyltransferase n=1 Tax=Sporomusa acidovorans (strain ATCC 49682 / DSM 3132 / Mol) TaxID=1123286 RepID=A0ABZ3IYT2_SPOA4|nr:molybdenum cofactor guanylyltransferase [Sporomusa acidovorans]OZC14183.1 putative molybdenum cofactor guanylyltransferase [Sporomusa acidovorans DSM 3132]SDE70677.1 molybdenum cofactor guanylyltransferase [Sporomusa acidovorans]
MDVSGIILAGGRSSRMGRDKTLLVYNDETMIERTVRKLRNFVDEIIVASNSTAKYNLPGIVEVPDTYPGMGPLGGMHAGLMAARHQYAFIVSCDMPFFTEELAGYLIKRSAEYDVIVPEIEGRLEPLCAVYSRNCVKPIEKCLQANVRQVYQFYSEVRVLKIRESELCPVGDLREMFYNLNTPEDVRYLRTTHQTDRLR